MSATLVRGDQSRLDSDVHITVARTLDEAVAMRPWFERISQNNLDSDLDYLLTVTRVSRSALRPHIVLFERPDSSAVLAVARIEQQPSRFPIRGTRVMRLAFGGVVGAETLEDCRMVVDGLGRALAQHEADVIVFSQIDVDGPLYDAVRSAAPWWRTDHMPRRNVHWRAGVPDSLDEFLATRSSGTRYHVRRYNKRLARAYGENFSVREFREQADLGRLHVDLESVAARTYQRGLGVGYTGDTLQRALMELGASRGWLRAWVLYISEMPVAFWFGYCYQGTFALVATGFDPAHGESRVGQYLQMQMMDSLCRDRDVHSFDYGVGDAEYKRRFGDHATAEAEIRLYAPSMRAARMNAVCTVRVAVGARVRSWVTHSDLGARAKKALRKRAQERASRAAGSGAAMLRRSRPWPNQRVPMGRRRSRFHLLAAIAASLLLLTAIAASLHLVPPRITGAKTGRHGPTTTLTPTATASAAGPVPNRPPPPSRRPSTDCAGRPGSRQPNYARMDACGYPSPHTVGSLLAHT